jgi:FAD/FMN-containing dehydrogenase
MTATTIDADRVDAFSVSISGTVLQPGEDHYEAARRVHNGLIDKRPALIARCHGAADVSAAVGLARETALAISIRGGRHNIAGRMRPTTTAQTPCGPRTGRTTTDSSN